MANNNVDDDLGVIITDARKLAIAWKHGFINSDHLYVAMLNRKCLATLYLNLFDLALWEDKLKERYPHISKFGAKDSLPLTIEAELVIKHCYKIAKICGDKLINTIHLLLAILSYENEISEVFNKAGILMEDITESYFKKAIKRFPSPVKPIRSNRYNRIEKLFLAMSGSKNKTVTKLHANASRLRQYQQFEDVISICQIGLDIEPTNHNFKILQIDSMLYLRTFEPALVLIDELVKQKPRNHDFRLMLSYVHLMLENHKAADDVLDALLIETPDNDAVLNNKGFNLSRQERYCESIPFFEKAILINPHAAYALNNLGFARYKSGDTEQGLKYINKSIELDKGNSFVYRNKGIVYLEQGEKDLAITNFNLALKFGFTEIYGDEVSQLLANSCSTQ